MNPIPQIRTSNALKRRRRRRPPASARRAAPPRPDAFRPRGPPAPVRPGLPSDAWGHPRRTTGDLPRWNRVPGFVRRARPWSAEPTASRRRRARVRCAARAPESPPRTHHHTRGVREDARGLSLSVVSVLRGAQDCLHRCRDGTVGRFLLALRLGLRPSIEFPKAHASAGCVGTAAGESTARQSTRGAAHHRGLVLMDRSHAAFTPHLSCWRRLAAGEKRAAARSCVRPARPCDSARLRLELGFIRGCDRAARTVAATPSFLW